MAKNLRKNMYVRCPFDRENPRIPRDFITGQITELDPIADTAMVKFMDPFNFRGYYADVPEQPINCPIQLLSRVSVYKNSDVVYHGQRYSVVSASFEEGWYYYYIQNDLGNNSLRVREDEILIPFTSGKVSPIEQLKKYEFQNPVWYLGRSVVSRTMRILENSVYGFKELAGCKIYLLPHQLNTIMRCLQEGTCRYMLADEVGMGKTIEAASILKVYLLHNANQRILVAVPRPLLEQWKTELFIKFDIEPGIDKKNNLVRLVGTDEIENYCQNDWNIVIVDEVHKLLSDRVKYDQCHELSRHSENIILLSATPVQQKEEQYLNLLRLILPDKYDGVSEDDFAEQVGKQKKITRAMYNILADLDDLTECMETAAENGIIYCEDDDCESIYEELLDGLAGMKALIKDEFLNETLDEIDEKCSDKGKALIQEAVVYVCDNYQLERNILRNRRRLILADMAKRDVLDISYLLDPERNTYEAATYEAIIDWVTGRELTADEFAKYYIPLIEAFFSSPWAFSAELEKQKKLGLAVSEMVEMQAAEWLREEDEIIGKIESVLDEPYNYSNRIVSTVDYIDQETENKKVVVFTNYAETFKKYEYVLKLYFGENTIAVFNKSMSSDDLELNIYRFQNDGDCKILICDETGGEGRNLQIADIVVHVDLPWDANAIEQRIGRLDRLGRDPSKTVLSIVMHTEDTLENELFRFWKEGLKVFTQSLSGLEIVMNEINESIISAVTHDFRYGISDAIEKVVQASQKMEKDVREEQLFDTASFIYGSLNQQLKVTLEKYHSNENQLFTDSMMGWAALAGFKGEATQKGTISFNERSFSIGSAIKSMFIPPLWEDYINKNSSKFSRRVQELYETKQGRRQTNNARTLEGTFDRQMAIENDYLHFFAPGDEVFDSIVDNALRSDKGQCAALMFESDFTWKGFVFTFTLEPNIQLLLENNMPVTAIGRFKNYITMDQIVVPAALDAYSDVSADKVISQLEKISSLPVSKQRGAVVHFGRRKAEQDFLNIKERYRCSNLEWFISQFPEEVWEEYVDTARKKAIDTARVRFRRSSSLKSAKREIDRMMNASIAKTRYFGSKPEALDKIRDQYMLIIKALQSSRIVVESAAFVWMVNANGRQD